MTNYTRSKYLEYLISEAQTEVSRADNKAALLLAALGIVAGALLSAQLSGSHTPGVLSGWQGLVWWLATALLALGAICLVSAVFPRMKPSPDHRTMILYFGDVFRSGGEISDRIDAAVSDIDHAMTGRLIGITSVLRAKYTFIRSAFLLLALSVAAFAAYAADSIFSQ